MSKPAPKQWCDECACHHTTESAAIIHSQANAALIKNIRSVLDDFNPKECNCDGEYDDGRLVGHACYFHRNEHILRELLAKAEASDE